MAKTPRRRDSGYLDSRSVSVRAEVPKRTPKAAAPLRDFPGTVGSNRDHYVPVLANSRVEGVDGGPPVSSVLRTAWPSAFERSYGSIETEGRESVLGQDDRVQQQNTYLYPWSAIASLVITAHDGSVWSGSAFFITPTLLLTAGHCVFLRSAAGKESRWAQSIRIFPGRNGVSTPFGELHPRAMYSSAGWVDHGLSSFDYGAIAIAPGPVQKQIGNFGYNAMYATNPSDRLVTVAGYPAGRGESHELYYDVRRVNGYNETMLYYDTDTSGGQSGGPVFVLGNDNSYYAIAIHTTGGTNANWGRRIDADVLTNIVAWSKQ